MVAAISGIIGPILPYILGAIAVLATYFGVKHKGAQEERARQVEKQVEAVRQVQQQVQKAQAKDPEIDKKVEEQKNEIVQSTPEPGPLTPGSDFRF